MTQLWRGCEVDVAEKREEREEGGGVHRVSTSHLGGLTQKQKSIKRRFAGFLSEGVLVRKAR